MSWTYNHLSVSKYWLTAKSLKSGTLTDVPFLENYRINAAAFFKFCKYTCFTNTVKAKINRAWHLIQLAFPFNSAQHVKIFKRQVTWIFNEREPFSLWSLQTVVFI